MKRRLKIDGFLVILAIFLTLVFPRVFMRRETNCFSEIIGILGFTLILLGQVFRASARGYKAEHSRNGGTLIRGGPYTLVRNPMYLGILLIGAGIALMMFKWWVICIVFLMFMVRYPLLILREEKKLSTVFPKEYAVYQQQVPRIFPALSTLFKKDISEYMPLKLSWLKREIGAMLGLLLVVLLIEAGDDIKQEGLETFLKEAAAFFAITIIFIGLVIYLHRRTINLKKDVSGKSRIS